MIREAEPGGGGSRRAPPGKGDASPSIGLVTVPEQGSEQAVAVLARGSGCSDEGDAKSGAEGESPRLSAVILRALNHEIRREALRLLHQGGEARSAIQLGKSILAPNTTISWHLRQLASAGAVELEAVRRVRGVKQKFFSSKVASHPVIVSILAETEEDDESIRR